MTTVLFERDGKVGWIRLNRPDKLNAMNIEMANELREILWNVSKEEDIRSVVISGVGKSFSAGGDLAEFSSGDTSRVLYDIIGVLNDCIRIIRRTAKIFIASIRGFCSGGGFGLMASCDLAVASRDAKFNMAYARIGASPDLSSSIVLTRTSSLKRASYLIFSGDFISAEEALGFGLVNFVVEDNELERKTKELAFKMADVAPLSVRVAKNLINRELFWDLDELLELEREGMSFVGKSEDIKEGIRAFFEKRKPNWKGR
ncbi:MAG: enoyl-CoA hydratase/isomerase family protein [Thermosulfidibacteraceae bacterium]|mgnify:CR=1 FL=1|jgi:2-(1,2-epoxy-1,2-dihydrophenyl)acetyl-CoA isomerase